MMVKILVLIVNKKGLYFEETPSLDRTRGHVRVRMQHLTNAWGDPKPFFSNSLQFSASYKNSFSLWLKLKLYSIAFTHVVTVKHHQWVEQSNQRGVSAICDITKG